MIEKGLAAWLLSQAPITAVTGQRVYPEAVPEQPTFPLIALERVGTDRQKRVSGYGNPVRVSLQLSCWALTYKEAKTLAETVRVQLKAATDAIPAGGPMTMGSYTVPAAWLSDDADGYSPPQMGEGFGLYYTSVTVEIWFNE